MGLSRRDDPIKEAPGYRGIADEAAGDGLLCSLEAGGG